ncbi:MAG: hypothetical protein A2149_06820 [Candidatus Schekmanbacteria bacterium RBG_16_38_11]|uniref:Uncharacterized protein n=1 Tax=Candidatus Schekmanbacteria bacterium RBG_16_38_11 TaxID=1817880 RepID=A0A1F7RVS6_9BACT|nr:MAG: hypothetical protein A2149_06820 [Candidatus Schekmanbacteria bacterium RBG_16_38_11]
MFSQFAGRALGQLFYADPQRRYYCDNVTTTDGLYDMFREAGRSCLLSPDCGFTKVMCDPDPNGDPNTVKVTLNEGGTEVTGTFKTLAVWYPRVIQVEDWFRNSAASSISRADFMNGKGVKIAKSGYVRLTVNPLKTTGSRVLEVRYASTGATSLIVKGGSAAGIRYDFPIATTPAIRRIPITLTASYQIIELDHPGSGKKAPDLDAITVVLQ